MATKSGKRRDRYATEILIRERSEKAERAAERNATEAWRVHRLAQLGVTVVALKN
jgi:hypothetical protein